MKNLNRKKNGTYQARIRFDSSEKVIYKSLKTQNQAIALKRLNELYNRLELEREGMIVPEKMKDARNEKILLHLSRYISDLEVTASSSMYIDGMGYRLRKLSKECGWVTLKQVDSFSFVQWRGRQSLSIKTLNDYLSGLNCFMEWLIDNGFLESNPIAKVKRIPVRGRHTFKRRAFTDEEIQRLLSICPEERKLVYVLALTTGLRRRELESIIGSDLKLSGADPHLLIRAETTKNGQPVTIHLHEDALNMLRGIHFTSSELILNVPSIELFKSDLLAAGIEYENSQKERADFHALRHTFCTRLARSGISPQIAKQLMRHSDMKLTTNVYTDSGQLGVNAALRALPSLLEGSKEAQKELKTAQKMDISEGVYVVLKMMEVLGVKEEKLMKAINENGAGGGTRTHTDFSAGF